MENVDGEHFVDTTTVCGKLTTCSCNMLISVVQATLSNDGLTLFWSKNKMKLFYLP